MPYDVGANLVFALELITLSFLCTMGEHKVRPYTLLAQSFSKAYSENTVYPGILYHKHSIQRYRGYKFLILNIYPVHFATHDKTVYYYKTINVKIINCRR